MMDTIAQGDGLRLQRGSEGERCEIAVCSRHDELLVYARTEGYLTQEVYGVAWHVGCVCVRRRFEEALLRAVMGPLGGRQKDVRKVLASFFDNEDLRPSDLLDLLDAEHVPYSYRSFGPAAVAFFRPECVAGAPEIG